MNKKAILITGDIVTLAVLTILGFATHGETEMSFLPRMAATFIPMATGWFLLTPWLGLFDEAVTTTYKNLLRIPLAFLFVAPMAVILRAAWLHTAGIPIFTLALGGTNALGLMVWRGLYILFITRSKLYN